MPDLPSGHVDKIDISVVANPSTQVNEVEQGKFDWMQTPPPPDLYAEVKEKYEGTQFRVEPTISNYYFWMNTTKPPFNDLKVRQAVNYAVDPEALERIYAGQLNAAQQILPPGMPGYKKFELYPYDMAKAKEMIEEANPSDRDITVWANTEPENKEATEYYEDVLRKLGFNTKLKVVNAANYFTVIGNQSTPDLDTGWLDWFEDYPNPNDFFQPLLSGGKHPPEQQQQPRRDRRPGAERKDREARRRTARAEAGSRIRRTRQELHGTGAVGPLRDADGLDLRLQRDRPRQGDLQPDLRPGSDQLPVQVAPGAELTIGP